MFSCQPIWITHRMKWKTKTKRRHTTEFLFGWRRKERTEYVEHNLVPSASNCRRFLIRLAPFSRIEINLIYMPDFCSIRLFVSAPKFSVLFSRKFRCIRSSFFFPIFYILCAATNEFVFRVKSFVSSSLLTNRNLTLRSRQSTKVNWIFGWRRFRHGTGFVERAKPFV